MFQIFAHRGLLGFPENTLLSFRKALERGFGIEADIHCTRDGKLAIIHDSAGDKTLDKIMQGRPGTPLLMDVLELFVKSSKQGTLAALHLKYPHNEILPALVSEVIKQFSLANPGFDLFNRVFVFDATFELAEKIKQLHPSLKIALSVGEDMLFKQRRYRAKYPTVYAMEDVAGFPHYDVVWADEWRAGLFSKEFIEKCRGLGKKVYAVSPELHARTNPSHTLAQDSEGRKRLWADLIKWGVDGVCTDYPEECRQVYDAAQ
ncbi:glycerophosphodiester phosphodiesterase [Candidatus Woesearchaeota archaeon]|nr:glycerophosphodiester phosphodiesterase [Candidatus Woesearchaeota archaeon]